MTLPAYLHAMRPHHWVKNLLVLLPLMLVHKLYEPALLERAVLAFIAFSLCASSVYLLNDLLDVAEDRRHPHKRARALAAGRIHANGALSLSFLLLAAAVAVGLALPLAFLASLGCYYLLMMLYSLGAKNQPVIDVLMLAGGYSLRVAAGAAAVGVALSGWLVALCVFLFSGLALIKRYVELAGLESEHGAPVHMRGYLSTDRGLLAIQGIASGYVAVLVLALYTTTRLVWTLSGSYTIFWLICLFLLYWVNYMWLMAYRERIHEDPVTFALRDRVSLLLIAAMAALALVTV